MTVTQIHSKKGPITRAQFDTEKIASCSDDYTINIWDLQTASLRDTLKEHTDEVWAMYFEGNVLLSGKKNIYQISISLFLTKTKRVE